MIKFINLKPYSQLITIGLDVDGFYSIDMPPGRFSLCLCNYKDFTNLNMAGRLGISMNNTNIAIERTMKMDTEIFTIRPAYYVVSLGALCTTKLLDFENLNFFNNYLWIQDNHIRAILLGFLLTPPCRYIQIPTCTCRDYSDCKKLTWNSLH